MACLHPIPAVDYGIDPETGKHNIGFIHMHERSLQDVKRQYGSNLLLIPCGKCIECKHKYADTWATRCSLESLEYENNYFITLTYDDAHLVTDSHDLKLDFQKFVRALRDKGYKFRYFGCGECGEKSNRMHLHIICFGLNLTDLVEWSCNGNKDVYYISETINSTWNKGFSIIGSFSYETARYTAGYTAGVDKKTLFTLSSRKPAIGYEYYKSHKDSIYMYDRIEVLGRSCPVPRAFDQMAEKEELPQLNDIKERRRMKSETHNAIERQRHGYTLLDYMYVKRADDIKAKKERRLKSGNKL